MWFLFLQIFFLLALAAVFGAVLAWWWMKRRYEDVTDAHEDMLTRMNRLDALANLPTRDELKASVTTLGASIAAIKPTDLSPLHERITRLEQALANLRTADLVLMYEKLAPVGDRLTLLEERMRSLNIPEVDLGPVHAGIASLDLAIGGKLGPVEGRITRPEGKLDETADLLDSAEYLNRKMREIRDSGKVIGLDRIAVMAALNIVNELLQARGQDEVAESDLAARLKAMRERVEGVLTRSQLGN